MFAQMGCEQDIAQFRLAVEIKAAQLAAEKGADEGLMELVAAMRRCEDEAQAAQLDLQFHKALVHNSGNTLLKIALDSVGSLMEYSVAHNRRQISIAQLAGDSDRPARTADPDDRGQTDGKSGGADETASAAGRKQGGNEK